MQMITASISVALGISAIILNGTIAYLLKRHKKTTIISFWLIYCLSVSDVMVGVTGLVWNSLQLHLLLNPKKIFLDPYVSNTKAITGFFMAFSGRLILIISFDRCIRMKYLRRYNNIMTGFRARLMMLCNVGFGVLIAFLESKQVHWGFNLGTHIFSITFLTMVYILYITTYVQIKKKAGGLESLETNQVVERNTPDQHNCGQRESTNNRCLNAGCKKMERHELDDKGGPSDMVKNVRTDVPNEERQQTAAIAEANSKNKAGNRSGHKQERRRAKPEAEFLKAISLILIVLFICYIPAFSYDIYASMTGDSIEELASIFYVLVLMNSSLNSVILIACNRELKRNLKTFAFEFYQGLI